MDYNNYDRGYAEPAMTSADYMSRTYRWMACGLLVTFAAAFVTAFFVVRYILDYITRHGFSIFAYWRIFVGAIGLWGVLLFK